MEQGVSEQSISSKRFFLRFFSRERFEISILYLLMGAGGLWHMLGILQTAMTLLATTVMVGTALWVVFHYDSRYVSSDAERRAQFRFWCFCIYVLSFALEYVGVKTGAIFGAYSYSITLKPLFNGVPLAIGFAWISMTLCSTAVVQRLLGKCFQSRPLVSAFCVALCMMAFDAFMEPAAVALGYWTWVNPATLPFVAPLQNYVVWFVAGCAFSWVSVRMRFLPQIPPALAFHAYWGQLLYFTLVNLR